MITQRARHRLHQQSRLGHSCSTFAPRPPRTSFAHDGHIQGMYTDASPVKVRTNAASAQETYIGASLVEARTEVTLAFYT
ncbi:hypothetical protein CDL15_Pgr023982 [Punica granatum]|uniref:Uncharacterized protein n=1 Tax=Punica granatum TaxID=22663 RepID=A0A218XVE7_PUNGR|nr:hypothetical protein CDL15_Pgr023982 [Punica granatum]